MSKKLAVIGLCVAGCFLLGAVTVETVDQLFVQSKTVSSWSDVFRMYSERAEMPPLPDFDPLAVYKQIQSGDFSFMTNNWFRMESGEVLYIAEDSKELGRLKLPLTIRVYDYLPTGETYVLSSKDGEKFKSEAGFDSEPLIEEGFESLSVDEQRSDLLFSLTRKRCVWEITLKPEADAWSDLLAKAVLRNDELIAAPLDGGMMMSMSVPPEHTNDLWLGLNGTTLKVYAPQGFTNRVEIYKTTDMVSSVWNIAVQNLMPVQTNPASWNADIGPRGFFVAGNMDVDTDLDDLPNAREKFVHKTDPNDPDTDGDQMPDGWEVSRGLSAKSSIGANGANGDPDGDNISNLFEYEAGTDPFSTNQLYSLSPNNLTVEYRSMEIDCPKFGWADFDTNLPVRVFKSKEEQYEKHVSTLNNYLPLGITSSSTDISRNTALEYTFSGEITTNYTGSYLFTFSYSDEILGSGSGSTTGTCQPDGTFLTTGGNTITINPPSADILISETNKTSGFIANPDNEQYYSGGGESNEVYLCDEYMSVELLENAEALLLSEPMPIWNTGIRYSFETNGWSTVSVKNEALRDLSALETNVVMQRIEYRFRFQGDAGAVYRISSFQQFISEGGGTTQVSKVCSPVYVLATGSEQIVERESFILEPPQTDGEVELVAFSIEMITPAGDPVNAPVDSGSGQNEFTFSSANPGVLTMNLKAYVAPSGVAAQIVDQCHFTVDAIGSSTMAWNAANPGGQPVANGDYLEATVTFTGLPINNSDFGTKQVAVYYDGNRQDDGSYETFFNKTATNHPNGQAGSPNWFYYWKDGNVAGIPSDAIYDPLADYGYVLPGVDNKLRLGPLAADANNGPEIFNSQNPTYGSLTVTGQGSGTLCVAETAEHELYHLTIYQDAQGKLDSDSDGVANTSEPSLTGVNSDINDGDTYRMRDVYGSVYASYGDNEVRARKKELDHSIQIYPERDWANPGGQNINQFGPTP